MKNLVQLVTYADRLGKKGLAGIHSLLTTDLKGVFGGIHLLPFYFPYDGADAGYDPIDHTKVDKRLGSWNDVSKLSEEFEVMGDIIVNHVSAQSKEFTDVLEKGRESEYFDLFMTKDKVFPNGCTESDIKEIYRPRPTSAFTPKRLKTGEEVDFWTTFTSNQLDIDVEHPLGKKYLNGILHRFSEAGIKMIRLDAAGYALKRAGTSCFMLPETYEFIDGFTKKAKSLGMEVLVEIHSHYKQQIQIASKVDFVYDFALPPLVLHSLRSKRFTELKKWLEISPRNCVTVLDTHDGIGVIDVAGDGDKPGLISDEDVNLLVESIHKNSQGQSRQATGSAASNLDLYQMNCTYYDALGRNDEHYLIARALQFFSPGIPQVYYTGLLAGENDLELLKNTKVGRDINRQYFSQNDIYKALEKEVVTAMIKLIKLRNEHPSFNGEFCILESDDCTIIMKWEQEKHFSSLKLNLTSEIFEIVYSDKDGIQSLNLNNNSGQIKKIIA